MTDTTKPHATRPELQIPIRPKTRYIARNGLSVTTSELRRSGTGAFFDLVLDDGRFTGASVSADSGDEARDGRQTPFDLVQGPMLPLGKKAAPVPHAHAELLGWIAAGHQIQWRAKHPNPWRDITLAEIWRHLADGALDRPECFRIKPRTIMIGNIKVPEPLRGEPNHGATVWTPNPLSGTAIALRWNNLAGPDLVKTLIDGLLFETEEGAVTAARAIRALFARKPEAVAA